MKRFYRDFSIVVSIALLFTTLLNSLTEPQVDITSSLIQYNAEAMLAIGQKLSFHRADLYDLELLPGVSDTIGLRLLNSKQTILCRLKQLSPNERYKAFTTVHGIGTAKAKALSKLLTSGQSKSQDGLECTASHSPATSAPQVQKAPLPAVGLSIQHARHLQRYQPLEHE